MVLLNPPCFIAVGASGFGGLSDIIELLSALDRPILSVVMVVLHRPSDRISHLCQVLARACDLPIIVASEAERLDPGTCYIGEPDGHLTLVDTHIAHLIPGSHNRLRNRTVDALFCSLALHAGARATGIVLSGALDDGSRGLAAIHAAGGKTMVLRPATTARGMQRNAIDYDGPITFIGSITEIARELN